MKKLTKYFVGSQEAKKDLLHLLILILVYALVAWLINIVGGVLSIIPIVNIIVGVVVKICILYLALCVVVSVLAFFKIVD
ncbi:MAG: hypothetical protein Q4C64_03050 [Erysipelotrichia bacterium]|nr:hypothetical protein [Erysipelotrichia bacterium]